VPGEKTGLNVPLLMVKLLRVASADGSLVTVIITVLVVTPSCAVNTVVMVFVPRFSAIACDGDPDATGVPFTVIVAVGSFAVGITWMLVTLFAAAALKFK